MYYIDDVYATSATITDKKTKGLRDSQERGHKTKWQ
jgi:hypothetical protein